MYILYTGITQEKFGIHKNGLGLTTWEKKVKEKNLLFCGVVYVVFDLNICANVPIG